MGARRVLVTGGAGFIGSHLVDLLVARGTEVTVLDMLTYAGNLVNLEPHLQMGYVRFERADVSDSAALAPLVAEADVVVHAAAETFVDRSIRDAQAFVRTNVGGTHAVLEACRRTGRPLLHFSTDEVYGSIEEGSFSEEDPLRPNSPYAATKASADLLCRAYNVTYGVAVTIVRGCNAFGPRQHPEKAIPTFVLAALQGRPVPVYGEGSNRREWLHVRDFAGAVLTVLDAGPPGGIYNLGGGQEISNAELARTICRLAGAPESLVTLVPDRPGHDFRYSLDWRALAGFGWRPEIPFGRGLAETVSWYRERREPGLFAGGAASS